MVMLGQQIEKHFEKNGVNLSQAAQALGISVPELNEMLHGEKRISAEDYYRICHFLGVDLNHFFNHSG